MDARLEAQIIEDFKNGKFYTAAAKTITYDTIRATYDNVNGVINCYNGESLISSINIAAMGLYGGRRRRRRTRRSRGSKKRRGTRRRHRRSRRHR